MRYEFIVCGAVPQAAMAQLPQLTSAPYPTGGTAIFGPVIDEAEASSVLALLIALGLTVVDMRRLPD